MGATACIVAFYPSTVSDFFWRRRLGSYHSHLFLSGRRRPFNATLDTATAISCWSLELYLYYGLIAWFSSRSADRAGGNNVLATAVIFWGEPPLRYSVLWPVSVGAAVAPVATH